MRRTRIASALLALPLLAGCGVAATAAPAVPPFQPACHGHNHHCPTPTPTPTTPTPTPTTPTPTITGPACTVQLGGACGPYSYPLIPMSNGFDTYVANQTFANAGTTQALTATSPGNWSLTANDVPYGYTGVQTYPDVQQLTNDWNGAGWGGAGGSLDTPLDSLSSLTVSYAESGPRDASSIYEFSPDIWSDNYGRDIMFWTDTQGRCNEGAFGSTVLGHLTIDGQGWTAHRYGGPGEEIILVLDGPGGPGTCAQQTSGTINIKAGLDWLVSNGFVPGPEVLTQLN